MEARRLRHRCQLDAAGQRHGEERAQHPHRGQVLPAHTGEHLNRASPPKKCASHVFPPFQLTCEARNSNLTRPVSTSLHVDMNFPPTRVRIEPFESPDGRDNGRLVAGREQKVTCRSSGSRPQAGITWYLDGRRLDEGIETVRRIFKI